MMIKLERVTKRKNCGFCNGAMQSDDFQVVEKVGTMRRTWCLRCGQIRITDRQKELVLLAEEVTKEMKKNPDRYVLTAMTER